MNAAWKPFGPREAPPSKSETVADSASMTSIASGTVMVPDASGGRPGSTQWTPDRRTDGNVTPVRNHAPLRGGKGLPVGDTTAGRSTIPADVFQTISLREDRPSLACQNFAASSACSRANSTDPDRELGFIGSSLPPRRTGCLRAACWSAKSLRRMRKRPPARVVLNTTASASGWTWWSFWRDGT